MRKAKQTRVASLGLAACLVAAMGFLSGCNTTEGLGKDMKSAGEAMSETARDAKD